MPAYLHAQLLITDPALYRSYAQAVAPVLAAHGGRVLVRGGAVQVREGPVLEGQVPERFQVLVEFPSMAALQAFYDAPEYAPLITMRQQAAQGTLAFIEGS